MKKRKLLILVGMVLSLCSGCGQQKTEVVQIMPETYEKRIHSTVEVMKGDLSWDYTLTLQAEGYRRITYDVTNSELQLDKVYVSTGDKVKKGDLLISFQSESLQETIEGYKEQMDQMQLLANHYRNLMKIDGNLDYEEDVKMLEEDIYILSLYLEEAKAKMESYQIKAEDSGTIVGVNEYLMNGYFNPGRNQITQICGTGNYTATTTETDCFTVGEIYTATLSNIDYELELRSIQGETLLFTPVSDMSAVSDGDKLKMNVQMPLIEDVVYVDKDAIEQIDDSYVVHIVDEQGYLEAQFVSIGQKAGDYLIITQGLEGGEKVAVN